MQAPWQTPEPGKDKLPIGENKTLPWKWSYENPCSGTFPRGRSRKKALQTLKYLQGHKVERAKRLELSTFTLAR